MTGDVQVVAPRRSILGSSSAALGIDGRMLAMLATLALIWVVLHILSQGSFLTARNLWNLAVQTSVVGIMAAGMVFVIVARHVDLSVGSLLGFIGMVIAVLQVETFPSGTWWNPPATLAIGLALGVMIGGLQGAAVAYLGVPAFIVTLGGLLVFRGAAWLVTSGRTVAPMEPTFQLLGGGFEGSIGATGSWIVGFAGIAALVALSLRGRAQRRRYGFALRPPLAETAMIAVWSLLIVGFVMTMNAYHRPRTETPQGIPIPVLILIAVVVVMEVVARTRRFGRYVYAIGGNPEAARLAGIATRRMTVRIFAVMGFLAALSGAIATARLNAGANSTGELTELSVIAAAVIGGTSLAGGTGTVAGAILGAVIMQSLENGMVLLGLPSAFKNVVIGLVLLAAVWLDSVYQRRRA